MKKLYTLFAALSLVSLSWGQYEVHLTGSSTDISGTVHVVDNVVPDDIVQVKFYIKNLTGSDQTMGVCRKMMYAPFQWTDQVCWAPYPDPTFQGGCYPASGVTWCSPTVVLPASGEGELIADVNVITSPGGGLYRYYFKVGGVSVDSVDLHINPTLGIDEPEPVQVGMTAYPNPASSMITVNTVGLSGDYSVRVTDVLGKVVYADEAGAIKKIDVSNFKNGVYLITVAEKGEAIQTRRVVVKH
ncbi:MAG: T9SS type A sorting domain-containing protein [Flavobacteriia bacterium]|nr:T9SS type A sorting domain-containing protein [Flavobacteriia bacterium]